MMHDRGALAIQTAARALQAACVASSPSPTSAVLHETYDVVLCEPLPREMSAAIRIIERKTGR